MSVISQKKFSTLKGEMTLYYNDNRVCGIYLDGCGCIFEQNMDLDVCEKLINLITLDPDFFLTIIELSSETTDCSEFSMEDVETISNIFQKTKARLDEMLAKKNKDAKNILIRFLDQFCGAEHDGDENGIVTEMFSKVLNVNVELDRYEYGLNGEYEMEEERLVITTCRDYRDEIKLTVREVAESLYNAFENYPNALQKTIWIECIDENDNMVTLIWVDEGYRYTIPFHVDSEQGMVHVAYNEVDVEEI